MGAGVAGQQVAHRVGHRLQEGLRHPDRRGRPEPVAQPGHVLDGHPALLAADPQPHRPPRPLQLGQPAGGGRRVGAAGGRLLHGQVAQQPQGVVQAVGVAGLALGGEQLQLQLQVGQGGLVDQVAQLLAAQQLGQDRPVQRQGLGPPLGQGGVALVHERGHVPELERAGERRRERGVDLDHPDLPAGHLGHQLLEAGQVEHVLEALAHRLQHHRERPVLGGDLEQPGAALALLPQGRAPVGPAPGQQQGPGRALAEAAGEQGRAADLPHHQVLDLVGVEQDRLGGRGLVDLGQPDHHPVVGVHGLDLEAEALPDPGLDGLGPGGVDLGPEGRVDADPPVAQLVPEALDHDGAVVGQDPGGLALLVQVGGQVGGGEVVQAGRAEPLGPGLGGQAGQLAQEPAQGPAQLDRPPQHVAVPERQLARLAGGRGDQHPVVGDVLDPPGRGAEGEHLPDPGLVDHLLVQLADPGGPLPDQEDAEQSPVGDGPAGGDGQALGPRPADQPPLDPVPVEPGPQLGELVRGVAARQHVEHAVQGAAGQLGERGRPPDQGLEVVDGPVVHGHHGHDLLGEHVQGVAGVAHGLDGPGPHALDHDRALDQVAAELGEHDAPADRPHLVAGPADALEAGRDRAGRLHLDDQVDRAHVDAQLQRAGRDHRGQAAGLEVLLDLGALLAADRAVVGPGQLGLGQLVEVGAEPLGQAAGVGEHDGRAVGPDQLDQPLVDVGPDRGPVGQARGRPGRRVVGGLADGRHVLDRDDHRQVEGLLRGRGDHRDRPGAAQEAGHLVQRPDGGRQADAAGRPLQQLVQALQAEGQVGPALGRHHRVDLVDDHRVDRCQGLASLGGEQQEQRLGGGDEDVGRVGREAAADVGRGVAGAHPDGDLGQGRVQAGGGRPQPGQRGPEIALDVGGKGLERGDVQDPEALALGDRPGRRPGGRWPTGTRPGSCPTRWARPPARPGPGRGRPRRRPGPGWARRRRPRTTLGSGPRTARARRALVLQPSAHPSAATRQRPLKGDGGVPT